MSGVPSLNQFNPGVGVYPSSWANGVVQGGALYSDLRQFSGLANMTVYMIGTAAPLDGGQGFFIWNSTVGATDDGGVTTIVPYGVTQGAWLRCDPVPPVVTGFIDTLATIAALRAFNVASQSVVYVQGYFAGDDGGEGMFWYNAADTISGDNGGTIIVDALSRRWYRETDGGPLSIGWFAGVPDGRDCSPALIAALAVKPVVTFGVGLYTMNSGVTYAFPNNTGSLTITGAGSKLTQLNWPSSTNGLGINLLGPLNSFHIRDMTLTTGQAPASGAAITLNQAAPLGSENSFEQSDITNVSIRGSDGPALTNYWTNGVYNLGVSGINFTNVKIDGPFNGSGYTGVGVGVSLVGTSTIIPVVFNFTGCNFNYIGFGIIYGAWVQGVTVSQCNFTGGGIGIFSPGSANGTVLSQLSVTASQFNMSSYGIQTVTAIGAVTVTCCYIFVLAPGLPSGIYLQQSEGFAITGNMFQGAATTNNATGIAIGTNPALLPGVITGNGFFRLQGGIVLMSGSGYVNVQSNAYTSVTTNVTNNGAPNTVGGGSP